MTARGWHDAQMPWNTVPHHDADAPEKLALTFGQQQFRRRRPSDFMGDIDAGLYSRRGLSPDDAGAAVILHDQAAASPVALSRRDRPAAHRFADS